MSYHNLTIFERGRIQELLSLGYSHRSIAAKIQRHRSCIDREILRNVQAQTTTYIGEAAQDAYHARREHSRPNGKWNVTIATTIEEKLTATWSPEQIANTITLEKISFKTIYNWLYQGKLAHVPMTVLRQKGKWQKPAETRGKFAVGISIHQRPNEVKSRETFGHWELYNALPKDVFKTGTTDCGKECACFQAIKDELDLTLYFADPYSPWQRGSNENSNKNV